jgi:methionyl-tRNA synthetase
MLLAAKLPNTHSILINGWITGEGGVKMSKSLGNTINPSEVVAEYGADALRFFVTKELQPFEDSPFAIHKFQEVSEPAAEYRGSAWCAWHQGCLFQ